MIVRGGLLQVHVLFSLAGHNSAHGVPVLGSGIDDGVNGFVVQNPAEVARGFGPRAFGLLHDLPGRFESLAICGLPS